MSGALASFVEKRATIVTYDGRTIVVSPLAPKAMGTIKGYDQTANVILADAIERVYSLDEPVAEEPLGLYIIRGDNIVLVGEMDTHLEATVNYDAIRADALEEIQF